MKYTNIVTCSTRRLRRMFYLGHKQGAGVNDVYEVSQATKERTL